MKWIVWSSIELAAAWSPPDPTGAWKPHVYPTEGKYGWLNGFPDYPTRRKWDEKNMSATYVPETIQAWDIVYFHQKTNDEEAPEGSWAEVVNIGASTFSFAEALSDAEDLPDIFSKTAVSGTHAFGMAPDQFDETRTPPGRPQRGVAAYRTTVPAETSFLRFGACNLICHVYIDGKLKRSHIGAYDPFDVVITLEDIGNSNHKLNEYSKPILEVIAVADNRFEGRVLPTHQPKFDWYQLGGIIRPVLLIPYRANWPYISRVQVHIRKMPPVSYKNDPLRWDWNFGFVDLCARVGGLDATNPPKYVEGRYDFDIPAIHCSWNSKRPARKFTLVEHSGSFSDGTLMYCRENVKVE